MVFCVEEKCDWCISVYICIVSIKSGAHTVNQYRSRNQNQANNRIWLHSAFYMSRIIFAGCCRQISLIEFVWRNRMNKVNHFRTPSLSDYNSSVPAVTQTAKAFRVLLAPGWIPQHFVQTGARQNPPLYAFTQTLDYLKHAESQSSKPSPLENVSKSRRDMTIWISAQSPSQHTAYWWAVNEVETQVIEATITFLRKLGYGCPRVSWNTHMFYFYCRTRDTFPI